MQRHLHSSLRRPHGLQIIACVFNGSSGTQRQDLGETRTGNKSSALRSQGRRLVACTHPGAIGFITRGRLMDCYTWDTLVPRVAWSTWCRAWCPWEEHLTKGTFWLPRISTSPKKWESDVRPQNEQTKLTARSFSVPRGF